MELIYNVKRSVKEAKDYIKEDAHMCVISRRNIVAFTSRDELVAGSETVTDTKGSHKSMYHVYVCDIDQPWCVYKVVSCKEKIVGLEWHINGQWLLIATSVGKCQIWEMKDHLINSWHCINRADLPGEEIIDIAWLSMGPESVFIGDKKEHTLYMEKMVKMKGMPSLTHFGGKPTVGWIAVTTTGMVCVGVPKKGSQEVCLQKASLDVGRNRLVHAHISYHTSGVIYIITSDGLVTSALHCHKVTLKKLLEPPELERCSISCVPFSSFYPKCLNETHTRDSDSYRVTHVQFLNREMCDVVLLGAGDINSSQIEVWSLKHNIQPLHRMFQISPQTKSYEVTKWVHQSSITHSSLPISIASPRFPITYTSAGDPANGLFQYIAVGYKDGSVKLINKANYRSIATTNLDMGLVETPNGEKKRKVTPYLVHMQQCLTGFALLGFDQLGCMYAMKVVNTRDPVTQVLPVYIVGMTEFIMMMGFDWWDVLPALRPGVIENVIQKLTDNFSKQPQPIQELIYTRYLAVKASLFRCSSGAQQRASDCHCRIMLHHLTAHFHKLIRPKVGTQNPVEKLNLSISTSLEPDLEKFIKSLNIDRKDLSVDEWTLQGLQPLVQWVGDLCLYLVTLLPSLQGYTALPGATLLRDVKLLSTLRELLVIIRIWGLVNPNSQPHFTVNAKTMDPLSQLFKILTKVCVLCSDGRGLEVDDSLIDMCYLVSSQVLLPHLDMFGNVNFTSSLFLQPHPVQFTFDDKPSHLYPPHHGNILPEGASSSNQNTDIVRYISLGASPADPVKACIRCRCVSLLHDFKKPAQKAWETVFYKYCICGGAWSKESSSVE